MSGQLGDGTTTERHVPVQVSGPLEALAGSAGSGYTCALHVDGPLYCWGSNDYGQLGNNSTDNSLTPVQVMDPY